MKIIAIICNVLLLSVIVYLLTIEGGPTGQSGWLFFAVSVAAPVFSLLALWWLKRDVSQMRWVPAILGLMLGVSLTGNVILWYRAESEQERADSNDLVTVLVSSDWAYWEAKRDFESGTLRRIRIKDPGETTTERPDSLHVIIDLDEEHPSRHRSIRAFVEVYNRTMEQLIANKDAPHPRTGSKR